MKRVATLRATVSVALLLSIFLQSSLVAFAQQCSKCTAAPTNDCKAEDKPPNDGGPACFCSLTVLSPGCVLKPCGDQGQSELCDSSSGTGSVEKRAAAYSHKCTGAKDECECCKDYPKDCTIADMSNPPLWGGEPCSCEGSNVPPGCILKPCKSATDAFCVCNADVKSAICFGSSCSGNEDADVINKCGSETPDPGDGATTSDPGNGGTTPEDDGNGGGGNGGSSVIVSFHILFASIVVICMRIV